MFGSFVLHLKKYNVLHSRYIFLKNSSQKKDLPVPNWLAEIINYFIKYVRPAFQPKKGVVAMWLNTKGKPLGIMFYFVCNIVEYRSFTEWVNKYVGEIFPGKHITPITFRSVLVSLIFEHELHEEGKTTEEFLVKYSYLINTSYKVQSI
jgi:hypothetical protein